MENLIFSYQGEEYVDSGVYEKILREEAKKQGVKIDRYELNMLLGEVEAYGKAEDYRGVSGEYILKQYQLFVIG
jgi:hypothetical protein